ncbi:MAG: rubredoxin [Magnetococcales bacterium]|nr:rubredoxin [Magnetococcales bacterium]
MQEPSVHKYRHKKNNAHYYCAYPGCNYEYAPELGDPEHGIAPGTVFMDLPSEWRCPECGANKSLFKKCRRTTPR